MHAWEPNEECKKFLGLTFNACTLGQKDNIGKMFIYDGIMCLGLMVMFIYDGIMCLGPMVMFIYDGIMCLGLMVMFIYDGIMCLGLMVMFIYDGSMCIGLLLCHVAISSPIWAECRILRKWAF